MINGAELGGATGAMAPLVFWSRSLKKSRKSRNQSLVVLSGTSCFYVRSAPMNILVQKEVIRAMYQIAPRLQKVKEYFH